jgi:hypothetical protein
LDQIESVIGIITLSIAIKDQNLVKINDDIENRIVEPKLSNRMFEESNYLL